MSLELRLVVRISEISTATIMPTHANAQQPPPTDQEQCRPAVFCGNGIGPKAREVCFTDKTRMVCSHPSEEEQREMRNVGAQG